jgi:Xaa-Pro aminopeptidase
MPDFTTYETRLTALLTRCQTENFDALIVPASDEHLNEYLPEAWKRRDWVCGFTGSAGDLLLLNPKTVPLPKPCQLFVDSRYYEQAELEVPLKWVDISKVGLPKHPTLADALKTVFTIKKTALPAQTFQVGVDFNTAVVSLSS